MSKDEGTQASSSNIAAMKEQLKQLVLERKKAGFVPYEGQWLPREEVRERLKQVQKKSRSHALELVILFGATLLLALVLLSLLASLVY